MMNAMNGRLVWVAMGVLLLSAVSLPAGTLSANPVFGSDGIVQREMPLPVWGDAQPGQKVTVQFAGQSAAATADKEGKWRVTFKPMKMSATGQTMTIAADDGQKIELTNVLIGDLWLCSGQSNMQWGLVNIKAEKDIAACNYPGLRVLTMPIVMAAAPAKTFPTKAPYGTWRVGNPVNARTFSAVAYYFGREVQVKTEVPIGLIVSALTSTRIEPWIAPVGYRQVPEMEGTVAIFDERKKVYLAEMPAYLKKMELWVKASQEAFDQGREFPPAPAKPRHPVYEPGDPANGSHRLFNGMIAPLLGFPIKGVIWYQGASNGMEQEIYYHKMRALIGGWRTLWGQGDFPVYYVQLPGWQKPTTHPKGGDGWAPFRDAQAMAMQIPNTGMAVAHDLGDVVNIHPDNKFDVGLRLAQWALVRDYGQPGVPCGPMVDGMVIEGSTVRLSFKYVGKGLMVGKKVGLAPVVEEKDGTLERFAIAGKNKQWYWAEAKIDGETVVLSSKEVPEPVAVRFAYTWNPEGANLFNRDGFPAAPFRTDDW